MDTLSKIYVEVTTFCNLSCEMCVQKVWDESPSKMSLETFADLMAQVSEMPEPPIIHLGGYGEPTVHPEIIEIVRLAKASGAQVEMTTNGMMLNRERADALFELELDKLVISVDGITPESYGDIRVQGDLDRVIQNLRYLQGLKLRKVGRHAKPLFALAFVAMKSNIHELPGLAKLASYLGAWEVKVSNVVPHTAEMEAEILYEQALRAASFRESKWAVNMSLPRLDLNSHTVDSLQNVYDSRVSMSMMGSSWSEHSNYCRFAQEGIIAIRMDGEVSPCLSLLHTHPEYIHGRERTVHHQSFGNIHDSSLQDIWFDTPFADFRQEVRDFDFSPCTTCGGCERFSHNYEDCTDHTFPTCGACLWAQGIIECP